MFFNVIWFAVPLIALALTAFGSALTDRPPETGLALFVDSDVQDHFPTHTGTQHAKGVRGRKMPLDGGLVIRTVWAMHQTTR